MRTILLSIALAISASASVVIDRSWDKGEYGSIHLAVTLEGGVYDYSYTFTNLTKEFLISYWDNTQMPTIFGLNGEVGVGRIENLPPFGLWFLPDFSQHYISSISFSTLSEPTLVEWRETFYMNGLPTQYVTRDGIGPSNIPEANSLFFLLAGALLFIPRWPRKRSLN